MVKLTVKKPAVIKFLRNTWLLSILRDGMSKDVASTSKTESGDKTFMLNCVQYNYKFWVLIQR